MKKIVLIGASGFVGSAILSELLSRDFSVTAVVRSPDKIKLKDANLTIKQGDVSSAEVVRELCKDADGVISAYNPGWKNPNMYEDTLRIYPEILRGVKELGVKRLLTVGGVGTLFLSPGVRVVDTGDVPESILPGVKALGEFYLDILMKEKDIDWVFFSPAAAFLRDGKRTGVYRLGKDDLIVDANGRSAISVEDFAKAMVDELERPQHHRERFTIGY